MKDRGHVLLYHWFAGRRDAINALSAVARHVDLTLPVTAEVAGRVWVRFRVAFDQPCEAMGMARTNGRAITVRFEGRSAEQVRSAILEPSFPGRLRHSPRYACCGPVELEIERGRLARAVVTDLGLRGAQLILVSLPIMPGDEVRARLCPDHPRVQAQVIWAVERTDGRAAGLMFGDGRANKAAVRRALRELAGVEPARASGA